MINPPVSKQPARLIRRLPIVSAIEPARRRHALLVRLLVVLVLEYGYSVYGGNRISAY